MRYIPIKMQETTLANIDFFLLLLLFFQFYFQINHFFIEEEDKPSEEKVVLDQEELDGIDINRIGNLKNFLEQFSPIKNAGIFNSSSR